MQTGRKEEGLTMDDLTFEYRLREVRNAMAMILLAPENYKDVRPEVLGLATSLALGEIYERLNQLVSELEERNGTRN
jgi:hypothetical protein